MHREPALSNTVVRTAKDLLLHQVISPTVSDDEATSVWVDTGETLAQAAYRALREDIIRGTRPPRERLRIEKLKALYHVGPTPLREALQMLAAEQLVTATGNRGFTVAPLDFDCQILGKMQTRRFTKRWYRPVARDGC